MTTGWHGSSAASLRVNEEGKIYVLKKFTCFGKSTFEEKIVRACMKPFALFVKVTKAARQTKKTTQRQNQMKV